MTKVALRRSDRWTGAVLAILMQAGLLALLIVSRPQFAPPQNLPEELIFVLPRLEKAAPPAPPTPARSGQTTIEPRTAEPVAPPNYTPTPAAPPDLQGLGQSIFGCAPETWSSLTPEQRARCPRPGEGSAIREAPDLLHPPPSQAKDGDHWAAELASRKSIRLPCTYVGTHALFPDPNAVMVDPSCLPKALGEFFHKLR